MPGLVDQFRPSDEYDLLAQELDVVDPEVNALDEHKPCTT